MAVSSYGSSTDSSGVVRILKDLDAEIEGKHVIIVEDIVDSGLTLSYLIKNLRSRKPASLEVCALLTKPARRRIQLECAYVGFEIPDEFVVGYWSRATALCRRREGMLLSKCQRDHIRAGARRRPALSIEGQA
jgi:hypoxanthine phosphoribosyltransferase